VRSEAEHEKARRAARGACSASAQLLLSFAEQEQEQAPDKVQEFKSLFPKSRPDLMTKAQLEFITENFPEFRVPEGQLTELLLLLLLLSEAEQKLSS